MIKMTEFGTWEPNFPDILLTATAVVTATKLKKRTMHTFPRAFRSSEEMTAYIDTLLEQYHMDPDADPIRVGPIYVTMLRYSRGVELKPEYWTGKRHAEFAPIRQNLFANMLAEENNAEPWQVVITPEGKKGKRHFFSAGMPVRGEKLMADVEAFMTYSDWHVDPTATHAALYSVIDEMAFKCQTRKIGL